ncbi:MAG TPA: hypothetical protein VIK92_05075 [Thermaerobacter sp.]
MSGELLLVLGLAALALGMMPGTEALGMPPFRLALWGCLLLVGSAVSFDVARWPVALSVNAGGVFVPVAAAVAWGVGTPADERRRGLWAMLAVAAVGFAMMRVLGSSPSPAWVSPPVLTGVTAGVIASLLPHEPRTVAVAACAGLLAAQCGVALDLALAAEPVLVTVGGAEGYDALVIGAVTGAALSLLGRPGGERP